MKTSTYPVQKPTSPDPIMVPLKHVRQPRSIQARVKINPHTVAEYAEAMRQGVKFPPIVVYGEGILLYLADGWHRVAAAELCGFTEILAFVYPGDRKNALRHALGANTQHGLRRSNSDKRRAVQLALKEFPQQSDRALAETCQVSQTMVSALRKQLTDSVSSPTRVGLDGKTRRVPVKSAESTTPPKSPRVSVPVVVPYLRMLSVVTQLGVAATLLGQLGKDYDDILVRVTELIQMSEPRAKIDIQRHLQQHENSRSGGTLQQNKVTYSSVSR